MKHKPRLTKPGAERRAFTPDNILTFTVPETQAPGSDSDGDDNNDNDSNVILLDFLLASFPGAKRVTVKDYLKHRQVMVDGQITTQFDTPLAPGAVVRVNTSREFQVFSNPRLKIVYEDDHIIVVNKGYGLLSVASDAKKDGTAYSLLRDYVKRVDPRNKVFIVHRLDQQTSGLMMFAKTEQAKTAMQYNWNNMVLERTYVAVVEGYLDESEGTIRSYLAENSRHEVYSTDNPDEGKLAVTRYRTLEAGHGHTLVELSLDPGRKNQIRVHLKDTGHPIAGDKRYGARTTPIHRMALHARTLRFIHPVTRKDMNFSTPVPAIFRQLL